MANKKRKRRCAEPLYMQVKRRKTERVKVNHWADFQPKQLSHTEEKGLAGGKNLQEANGGNGIKLRMRKQQQQIAHHSVRQISRKRGS